MVSSGMMHSPVPGQPLGAPGEASISAARPAARKSQIIEEEEDDDGFEDEIEEVDEFEDIEEDHPNANQPDETIQESSLAENENTKDTTKAAEPASPSSTHQPALEPAPELESSPVRPPRSSSLRSPPPEAAAAVAAVITNETETADETTASHATEASNDTITKPAAPSE